MQLLWFIALRAHRTEERGARSEERVEYSAVLGTKSVPTFIWKPNCTPIDAINHAACHANSGIRTRDDRAKFNFFVGREDSRAASSATVEMYCILELLKLSSIILVGKFA